MTPYGGAMHQGLASYWVWPLWMHVLLSWMQTVFQRVYWTSLLLAALHHLPWL